MKSKKYIYTVIISVLTLLSVNTGLAHHSFYAQFDSSSPVTLTGTITRVDWRSPHIWVFMDVTNEDGSVASWQCEGGAPNALVRNGYRADSLAIGTELTIYGYRAFNEPNICNGRGWTYQGEEIFGRRTDGGPDAQQQGQ